MECFSSKPYYPPTLPQKSNSAPGYERWLNQLKEIIKEQSSPGKRHENGSN